MFRARNPVSPLSYSSQYTKSNWNRCVFTQDIIVLNNSRLLDSIVHTLIAETLVQQHFRHRSKIIYNQVLCTSILLTSVQLFMLPFHRGTQIICNPSCIVEHEHANGPSEKTRLVLPLDSYLIRSAFDQGSLLYVLNHLVWPAWCKHA